MNNDRSTAGYIILIAVAAVLLFNYFYMPELGFRFNDGGLKYIHMRSIHMSGWKSHSIPYPGSHIDPDFEFIDYIFTPKNGRLYSSYQPLFPFLTSLFYPLLGNRSAFFLPMLSFFLSVILLGKILRMILKRSSYYYLLIFIYSFASPVILYSFTFWEHLPAVLAVLAGLYYIVRYFQVSRKAGDMMIAMGFIAFSALFRSEMLLVIFSLLIAFSYCMLQSGKRRDILRISVFFLVLIGLYIINNVILFKHNGLSMDIYFNFMGSFAFLGQEDYLNITLITVVLLSVFVLDHYNRKKWHSAAFAYFIVFIWLGYIMKHYSSSPVIGLFLEFPVCLFMFTAYRPSFEKNSLTLDRLIFYMFTVYLTLSLMLTPYTPHRSVRYYLAIVPFVLVFLATKKNVFENSGAFLKKLLILFSLLSLSMTVFRYKTDIMYYKYDTAARIEFIKKHTESDDIIIFTNDRGLEIAGPMYFDRVFLVGHRIDVIERIMKRLHEKSAGYSYVWCQDKSVEKYLLDKANAGKMYRADKIYYYDQHISLIRLTIAPAGSYIVPD